MESTPNRPVQVFNGSGVKASIFRNRAKTDGGDTFYSYKTTLERFYHEKWNTISGIAEHDLPVTTFLLQKAWNFIVDAKAKDKKDS